MRRPAPLLVQALAALAMCTLLAPGVGAVEEPLAAAPAVTASPPSPALMVPKPLRLRYKVFGKVSFLPYQARATLIWTHDATHYDASMEVQVPLLGARVQTSRGQLMAAGLQPQHFVDRVHDDRTVDFDYGDRRIRFSEGTPPEPLPAGAQDQLSVFVQLGSMIAATPGRYPKGSEIVLPVMGIYGPETWRFIVNGDEKLQLPGGEQATLKLSRPPARGDDPGAEVWLAPALGWLPARIRLSQPGGDYVDQQWRATEAP